MIDADKEDNYENMRKNLGFNIRGMGITSDETKRIFNDMAISEIEKKLYEKGMSEFVKNILKDGYEVILSKHSEQEYNAMSKKLIDEAREYEKDDHTFRETFFYAVKKYIDMFGLDQKQATRLVVFGPAFPPLNEYKI